MRTHLHKQQRRPRSGLICASPLVEPRLIEIAGRFVRVLRDKEPGNRHDQVLRRNGHVGLHHEPVEEKPTVTSLVGPETSTLV